MGFHLTAFLGGAAIMALEILGFRLLPPYFGYSMAVWGCLLGVVMVALAGGYYLGGRLADRRPHPAALYPLILVAAGYTLLLLVAAPAILRAAARLALVPGALLATTLLFAVPMTALSTISPFLTRLLAARGAVGSAAGGVYAVSTAGSIVGTLLTSFYLIPVAGTRVTLGAIVGALAGLGALGLVASRRWAAGAVPAGSGAVPAPRPGPAPAPPSPGAVAPTAASRPAMPDLRRAPLWIAGLALAAGVVAAGFSPPARFALMGRDLARWVERFGQGQEEAVVRVEAGAGRVPFILPGPADPWAGSVPHRIRVEFTGLREDALLLLEVPEAHAERSPRLTVAVNGRDVARIRVRRGTGVHPLERGGGPPREYVVRIPASAFEAAGPQTLTLANREGAWLMLSGVSLLAASSTFSAAHYLDLSPPPRSALPLFAIGLVALWATDPRRAREKLAPLAVVGAGLGLLGFLALGAQPPVAHWHVLLVTHRGLWLLLVLSFVVPLLPGLGRLCETRALTVVAFVTGAVGMMLEMAGFRLLSPFFGYSSYVWGALLAVVMAALALGYFLGGWLADRRPQPPVLSRILLLTALLALAIPYVYAPVIRLTAGLPLVWGALLAAFVFLFLPMAGLGMAAPFVIRLLAASDAVGLTTGRIYAISTVGSLVGTFASAFVLITTLGPQETWVAGSLVLLLVLLAQGIARGPMTGAHWLGVLLVFTQPLVPEFSVASLKGGMRIYESESEYSHLEVIEVGKTVQLVPQLRFVHTIYDEERAFEPIISYGLLPSFLVPEPEGLLHLGMGGGTLARVYLRAHPGIRVDGVDIDPEVIRLGRRFLGLADDPRLRIVIEDARAYVRTTSRVYDVVVWDLFQGGVFVPHYALTREFFEETRDRVTERGVFALFIARPSAFESPDHYQRYERLFKSVGNTLAAVFPTVVAYPVTKIGYYFVATRQPTALETVRARLEAVEIPELREPLRAALRGLVEYRPDPAFPILTDDLAPVDQLIYDAFFRG